MSRSADDRERAARQAGAALAAGARATRREIKRQSLGLPGKEPYEVRRPLWRGYLATWLVYPAVLLTAVNVTQAGFALMLVALVVGAPKAWLWVNDRVSALLWAGAAAMLLAGEALYVAGGPSARATLTSAKHGPGAAGVLIALCGFVAWVGCFRRWGTSGNVLATSRRLRAGDPEAHAQVREGAVKEGAPVAADSWTPPDAT